MVEACHYLKTSGLTEKTHTKRPSSLLPYAEIRKYINEYINKQINQYKQ